MEQGDKMLEEDFKEDSLKTCITFVIGGTIGAALFIGTMIFIAQTLSKVLSGG